MVFSLRFTDTAVYTHTVHRISNKVYTLQLYALHVAYHVRRFTPVM